MLLQLLIYLLLGTVAGTIAGLFGIGGGLIIVPILHYSFVKLGFPKELIMHMALGTSLSTIFVTGMSSVYSHNKLGSIDWVVFKKLLGGVIIGTFIGGRLTGIISGKSLEILFIVYVCVVALKTWIDAHVHPQSKPTSMLIFNLFGFIIGFKSSLLGIGGGTISIPFLTWRGFSMKKSVGISATLGLPIALVGSASYIYNGLSIGNLPEYSVGYIYLPALIGITSVSSLFARFGAKLSHKFPQDKMRKGFALLLVAIAIKGLASL
ncbi:MAG: hypothetical protein COW00_09245 [Bdellovibrio sp. CG12_big_fil_rev_8_21_14_0_65_39_13]|nr:MAG: hypothetical protein COW78_09315 [Bdellovibrio sp. CG22_combo_CG10-13_8_21_14_all_39_27]PIQ59807.1 MAG: hypothetical protein COW00_09245 [Bdellovibrio sp. CG12_big_fil_rev_8_21_14_0_65_39_13]PIR36165.1 MAG: hypothetical protein COV37_04145 [Bdellovibrio sp. CG11_big_fil_rev_8_21_14_0_20_39_38]PJB52777.1 MAG: hypothetical protein CO099_10805 [Bdellovibrio sp. CG_4_9_14_3_um_filter_39_7]